MKILPLSWYILSIAFLLLAGIASAQQKEVYLNDDFVEITKAEFNEPHDPYVYYKLKYESDTVTVNVKVQRIKKGKVTPELLDEIRKELSLLSDQPVPEGHLLVINYYHGPDPCNSGNHRYFRGVFKRYVNKVRKMPEVNQFFIYKNKEGIESAFGKQHTWIEDRQGIIEKTFLPLHYPCGSFVVLDKTGRFYIHKGEYNVFDLLELIENPETIFTSD